MIQVGRTMSNAGAKAPVDEDVPVGPCRLTNSVLIWAAVSFSMLYFSSATEATLTPTSSLKSMFVPHLGERARVRTRGRVDLLRDKLVLETRLGVYKGKLRAGAHLLFWGSWTGAGPQDMAR